MSRMAVMLKSDRVRALLAVAAFAGIALAAMAPGIVTYPPTRDSGVFLYAGQRVLQGDIPYRDFWDHKGPLVYYIDALGLLLGGGSMTGVWTLEFVALVAAAALGFLSMRSSLGDVPAFLAGAISLVSLAFVLGRGNFTEEYALPFQFLILLLFERAVRSSRPGAPLFGLGLAAGACFLLRPNCLALPAAAIVCLTAKGVRERKVLDGVRQSGAVVGGAVLIVGLAGLFLVWHSAIDEAVDAVFRYNLVYISHSLEDRVDAVLDGLSFVAPSGIGVFGILAWGLAVRQGTEPRGRGTVPAAVTMAVVALPLELLLTAVAGRSYDHYYISWLPALAVLNGYFLQRVLAREAAQGSEGSRARLAWIVGYVIVCGLLPGRRLAPQILRVVKGDRDPEPAMVAVIKRWLDDDDFLLMWGAESSYNFILGRPSPSRFVYLWPLYTCGYTTTSLAEEFRDRVLETRPIIVDASWTNARVPPLDPTRREAWLETASPCLDLAPLREVLRFVDTNYEMVEDLEFEFTRWSVYRPLGRSEAAP
jgi:hypothetical protein